MNYSLRQYFYQKITSIFITYKIKYVLIAISGGQDSLCLIELIEAFNKKAAILNKIEYIYIDHQWKTDSKTQIIHLINYLDQYNQQLSIYQIQDNCLKEKIARSYRYHTLINHAINNQYQVILTAHSQTDRIETFIYNLIKGTSLDGASSLTIHRNINNIVHIIRPLIYVNRSDINYFCRKCSLPIWSDITNYNLYFTRNRIRHELIPYIVNYYNIHAEHHINQFLNICDQDNEYIKQNTLKLYMRSRHVNYIALNYKLLKKQHPTLIHRILQLFFFHNFQIIIGTIIINKLTDLLKTNNAYHNLIYNKLQIKITYLWIYVK
uniref:tRNA(Ile)-lysidine synthase n=1 Tax=Bornetia secundiflora TaxID=2575637 RepID=A0A4D6WM27_9FLOR|nr:tRNA Ile-lysidine synthetase [Bornetia secundiflora]